MCKKKPYCGSRIDECLIETLEAIRKELPTYKTLACCCGHGKYPKTIICEEKYGDVFEFFTFQLLKKPKQNRFYKKDKQGYYYLNPDLIIESEGIFPHKKIKRGKKNG